MTGKAGKRGAKPPQRREKSRLTLGPLLYHWPAEKRRDFYFRIADEADIDEVFLGEVVCSKREPFFEPFLSETAERLRAAGKRVVYSTFALITTPRELDSVRAKNAPDALIEVNDMAAVQALDGKPFAIGPLINVFNEGALDFLARKGAVRLVTLPELSAESIGILAKAAKARGIEVEVPVFGRQTLSVSMRCYHARSLGLHKDNCQFVCERDPDGLPVGTLSGQDILTINGVQTMSHGYLALLKDLAGLRKMGVGAFRLSPQDTDMVRVAEIYRAALDGKDDPGALLDELREELPSTPFINGYMRGGRGLDWAE